MYSNDEFNLEIDLIKNFCCINKKIYVLTNKGHILEINKSFEYLFYFENEINFKNIDDSFYFKVLKLPPIVQMVQGNNHILLLDGSGSIFSFGDNKYGQLGINDDIHFVNDPQLVQNEKSFIKLFAFSNISLAIERNGKYYVWGEIKENNSNDYLMFPMETKRIFQIKTNNKSNKNKFEVEDLDYFHNDEIIKNVKNVIENLEKEKKDNQSKIKEINKILNIKLEELKKIETNISNYDKELKNYNDEYKLLNIARMPDPQKRHKENLIKHKIKNTDKDLNDFKKEKREYSEDINKEKNKINLMNKNILDIDKKIKIFIKIIKERKINMTKKNINNKMIIITNFLNLIEKKNLWLKKYKIDEYLLNKENDLNSLDHSLFICETNLEEIKEFLNNEKNESSHAFSQIFEKIILLFETNVYYIKEYNKLSKTHLSKNNEYLNKLLKDSNDDEDNDIKWGKNKVKGLYDKIVDLKNYFIRQN